MSHVHLVYIFYIQNVQENMYKKEENINGRSNKKRKDKYRFNK